jgi:predicted PurR-regulated permease PerM
MPKIFVGLISIILLAQILFSFFYSSSIITQNSKLIDNQTKYDSLKLEVESLEQQVADINSIKNISSKTADKNLQFIKNSLN